MYYNFLDKVDPQIAQAIRDEASRQQNKIEMIASENFTSRAVMEACGSEMTNKYAEGYPGKRYYGGCEFVDVAEKLAIDRVKELFGAEHANVQAHCGASANMGVYLAMLKPGDTVMVWTFPTADIFPMGPPSISPGCISISYPTGSILRRK